MLRKTMEAVSLFLLATLSGCAIAPEQIAARTDLDVCKSYGVFSRSPLWAGSAEQYRQEIVKRNLLTHDEWELANQKKIKRGMSQCALYASWGSPDKENRSVGSWGINIQHVYNTGYRYTPRSYVYTENGKVTSWQD